jgi:UDP-glucuronate 4-epimerase
MKVLITGAAGFVGGNLAALLKSKNIDVKGVDSFSGYYSREMKNIRIAGLGISDLITNFDITSHAKLEELLNAYKPNTVIHLAAQGGVRASRIDPSPYIASNQQGFLNVLELSERHGVQKFIYASSSSVYGDQAIAPFREDAMLSAPKSLYALSKLSNEIVASHFPGKGMQRIGLRLFTVYGPWGRPDMAIFRLLASYKLGEKFQLTANLSVLRDFTFVDDASQTIFDLMTSKSFNDKNEILNIAGGKPYSLQDLLDALKAQGIEPVIEKREHDPLDVNLTHGSTKKLAGVGLSVPNTSLADGLRKTIKWMESQSSENIRTWYEYSK